MYARVVAEALEDLSDASLIRRFKLGDHEALNVLLRRHSDSLNRFCHYLVANREDAEDIYQETLTRAISRVDTLEVGTAFRSWLFRIARNLSVDTYRTRKRTLPLLDDEVAPIPDQQDGPEERIEVVEEHRTVVEALSNLAQSHQKVLVLREVQGLSYAAIAEEMEVSQSAVETLLFRARRRLREEYSKREAAVSGLAVMTGLRDLVTRVAGPLLAGPPVVAKVAVTAAMVGGAMAWTEHMHPQTLLTSPAMRQVVPARASSRGGTQLLAAARPAAHSEHHVSRERTRQVVLKVPAKEATHHVQPVVKLAVRGAVLRHHSLHAGSKTVLIRQRRQPDRQAGLHPQPRTAHRRAAVEHMHAVSPTGVRTQPGHATGAATQPSQATSGAPATSADPSSPASGSVPGPGSAPAVPAGLPPGAPAVIPASLPAGVPAGLPQAAPSPPTAQLAPASGPDTPAHAVAGSGSGGSTQTVVASHGGGAAAQTGAAQSTAPGAAAATTPSGPTGAAARGQISQDQTPRGRDAATRGSAPAGSPAGPSGQSTAPPSGQAPAESNRATVVATSAGQGATVTVGHR